MTAREYYYSEENKINPRHDLPEGVICLKEEELFQLMEEYALYKIVEHDVNYFIPELNDTTGDTTEQ